MKGFLSSVSRWSFLLRYSLRREAAGTWILRKLFMQGYAFCFIIWGRILINYYADDEISIDPNNRAKNINKIYVFWWGIGEVGLLLTSLVIISPHSIVIGWWGPYWGFDVWWWRDAWTFAWLTSFGWDLFSLWRGWSLLPILKCRYTLEMWYHRKPRLRDSYNFVEIKLSIDSKGYFAQNAFISHHTYIPKVNFFIILFLLYNLWGVV